MTQLPGTRDQWPADEGNYNPIIALVTRYQCWLLRSHCTNNKTRAAVVVTSFIIITPDNIQDTEMPVCDLQICTMGCTLLRRLTKSQVQYKANALDTSQIKVREGLCMHDTMTHAVFSNSFEIIDGTDILFCKVILIFYLNFL